MAVFVVLLSLAVLFVPLQAGDDAYAAPDDIYTYTLSTTTDDALVEDYDPIGSSSTGLYTSLNGTNSGSWAFDENGYGPFNSFYAAFDPAQNNRMICHLNPYDLSESIIGESIAGQGYNIMWCLPTVYWYTSGSSLVLTNDPDAGGTAYAHTINGHVYEYIGIGVYEASTDTVGGQTILTSTSGTTPLAYQTRATFRDYANNQTVNTDGNGTNGYAMVWNFYQWELYKYCAIAVMDSWNSQYVAGNGDTYDDGTPIYSIPGELDQSGPYAGNRGSSASNLSDPVKVFIENAWGSINDFVDGIVINGESGYYIDQSAVPTDAKSGTYVTYIAQSLRGDYEYGSSPCTSHAEVWGMPTASSGTSSSGTCDYIITSSNSNRVLFVGGYSYNNNASNALRSGLSYAHAFEPLSTSSPTLGGRLAFVFDADPAAGNIVTFDHNTLVNAGGDASDLITSILVPDNGSCQLPDLGVVDGFKHTGWYINGIFYPVGAYYTTTGDVTAYSAWMTPSVTITMYVEGSVFATLAVPKGSSGVVFTPVNVDGIFTGWYYDSLFTNEYDPVAPINEDLVLYAKGVPPLTFTTDPIANGDIVALDGQPGTISYRATDSMYYSSVLWDFGDGSTSTDLYATHYYAEPGSYTATLTVFNNYGSDTTEFIIEVPADHSDDGIPWALYIAVVVAVVLIVVFVVTRVL